MSQITRAQFDRWLEAHGVDFSQVEVADVHGVFIDEDPEQGLMLVVDFGEEAHRAPLTALPGADLVAHVRRTSSRDFRVSLVAANGEPLFTGEALKNHSYALDLARRMAPAVVDETGIDDEGPNG